MAARPNTPVRPIIVESVFKLINRIVCPHLTEAQTKQLGPPFGAMVLA